MQAGRGLEFSANGPQESVDGFPFIQPGPSVAVP